MIHSIMSRLRMTPLCADMSLSNFYFSLEMCDEKQNFTMCPLCDRVCDYWHLSTACGTARASHLFDNPATVFFAIFMSLWGMYYPLFPHFSLMFLSILPSQICLVYKTESNIGPVLYTALAFPCSDECKTQVTGCGSKQICWCVSMEMEKKTCVYSMCGRLTVWV